jgi:hypothetical protein
MLFDIKWQQFCGVANESIGYRLPAGCCWGDAGLLLSKEPPPLPGSSLLTAMGNLSWRMGAADHQGAGQGRSCRPQLQEVT